MRAKRLLVVALFAGFALAGPIPTALAVTFTANSTADEPDLIPGDGLCLAAKTGGCSLRAAVQETNALGGGPHSIALVAGAVYTLTRAGAGEDAAAKGDLDIASNVTISVPGGRAVVAGTTGWDDRIFHVLFGATVELKGLDIQNGSPAVSGGGIANMGTLTLTDSTVSGNTAGGDGGGIFNAGERLTLTNSTVSGNSNGVHVGGGIYNILGTVALTNCMVSGNSGETGGGVFNDFGGTLSLTNSTVSGNGAVDSGGGIFNILGTLSLTNSTVSGNSAVGSVSGYSAVGSGGGIYNASARLTLTNGTVSGNRAAGDGGGIWTYGSVSGNNLTIARNVADSDADGSGDGGGIFNVSGGTVSFTNTLVGENVDASAATKVPDCLGSLSSGGYNLIQNTTGCTIVGDTTGNIIGRAPQLGPLEGNGGPTFTHALVILASKLGGFTIPSPAIDAGSPGGATACAGTDQRGIGRPLDGNADGVAGCDIGAYEYVPPFLRPPLGTWALTPAESRMRPGERLTYELTWTVPPPRGWRTLDTVHLRLLDDEGTALWVRFREILGSPGVFSVVDARNGNVGPDFAPGSPNRLESEFATVYLAASSVDGPPGPRVTLTLTLSFKPHAAGRVFDVLVGATDDAGDVQGFHRAGAAVVTR